MLKKWTPSWPALLPCPTHPQLQGAGKEELLHPPPQALPKQLPGLSIHPHRSSGEDA